MHGRLLLPLLLLAAAGCTSVKTSLREPLPPPRGSRNPRGFDDF